MSAGAPARPPGWVFAVVTAVAAAIDALLPLFNRFACAVGEHDDAIGCTNWPADAPWIGAGLMLVFGFWAWRLRSLTFLVAGVAVAAGFGLWGWSTY